MTNPLSADLDHILDHTRDLWEQVRGKRVFITGGTGFFGCWLLESFCWANDYLDLRASATVLTRNSQAFQRKAPHLASHPAVHLHSGDVRSFGFPEGEFSHIIHAATEASAKMSDENPLLMLGTIVEGTRHTLEFARHCGTPKFLLTSSGAVYGKQPPTLTHIPEDYIGAPDPLDPRSVYGEGKRLAEQLCALYAQQYGVQSKIARCFAFVGPCLPLDIHFAIGNFIRDGLRGAPIKVKGDGTSFRSYLYAADLTIWLWTILFSGKSCRPYNVGSDEPISILELAHKVVSCLRDRVEVLVMSNSEPGRESVRYVPNIDRGKSELGLQVYVRIENAIEKTIVWVESR
jgi:nucleoside-diphosphate-sugar epimerase